MPPTTRAAPTEDYVARLWKIGVRASVGDVVTVGGAMQHLLAETRSGSTAFVVGTEALFRHVTEAGLRILNGTDLASRAEVVVVGGTEDLVYDDLRYAALAVRRGADFLATGARPDVPAARRPVARNRRDPRGDRGGERPAGGDRGKARAAADAHRPRPLRRRGRTLVVGDRVDTDLAAAAAAELDAALVLSGGTERAGTERVRARARRGQGNPRRT